MLKGLGPIKGVDHGPRAGNSTVRSVLLVKSTVLIEEGVLITRAVFSAKPKNGGGSYWLVGQRSKPNQNQP